MRLIFSRKGFDSTAGGCASPIFPDGTMLSLPIPDKPSSIRYSDLRTRGHVIGAVVEELTCGKQKARYFAHLDPDLEHDTLPREPGWQPVLGQAGSSQRVLEREGVGPGDLFLFFGWFREVEASVDGLRFVRGASDLHVLWGWLQIDRVLRVGTDTIPPWAHYHPHVTAPARAHNTLYVARETLSLPGLESSPGAGTFERFRPSLQLTKPGATRGLWQLPAWLEPTAEKPPLGYHSDPKRWQSHANHVDLRTASRGQEFVLDVTKYPEALAWLRTVFAGV